MLDLYLNIVRKAKWSWRTVKHHVEYAVSSIVNYDAFHGRICKDKPSPYPPTAKSSPYPFTAKSSSKYPSTAEPTSNYHSTADPEYPSTAQPTNYPSTPLRRLCSARLMKTCRCGCKNAGQPEPKTKCSKKEKKACPCKCNNV